MTSDNKYLESIWDDSALDKEKHSRTNASLQSIDHCLQLIEELRINSLHISDGSIRETIQDIKSKLKILYCHIDGGNNNA